MKKFIKKLLRLDGNDLVSAGEFEALLRKYVRGVGGELSDIIPSEYKGKGVYNVANEFILVYKDGLIERYKLEYYEYPWKILDSGYIYFGDPKHMRTSFEKTPSNTYQVDTMSQWREFKNVFYKRRKKGFYNSKMVVDLGNYIFNILTNISQVSDLKVSYEYLRFNFKYFTKSNKGYLGSIFISHTDNDEIRTLIEFEDSKSLSREFKKYLYSKDRLVKLLSILENGEDNFNEC